MHFNNFLTNPVTHWVISGRMVNVSGNRSISKVLGEGGALGQ